MTYVMSDIHGQGKLFNEMLKKINFKDEDELYILGDVIDRGPDGIKLLLKTMRSKNIHMLLGNHELMMLNVFFPISPTSGDIINNVMLWYQQGGRITKDAFLRYSDSTKVRILSYIKHLPVQFKITVNGREFLLCHASPHPSEYRNDPFEIEENRLRYSTDKEFAVWDRHRSFITDTAFNDKTVIFGHTPTFWLDSSLNPMRILKGQDIIDIDCGCAAIPYHNNELGGCLGCLRLEDMKEFYVSP